MSKKKTPDGERCERTLPFKLNDEDKARKGEIAGKLNKQLEAAVEAKKIEVSKHNAKITDFTKKISAELKMINEGIERRAVTCTAVKNFEANVIEFWFEGIVLETVPLKAEDRQLTMKDGGKKEKWQRLAPKRPLHKDPEDEKDEEIASVHKMETSRKGASSAVDPK